MKTRPWDLIVVGGGPAGSTLATLVKKHDPARRVLLLEKAAGPQHKVGESLLPGLVPVLKEMGAYEKIDGAGFPRKLGATYIWGKSRTPWENDFNDVNMEAMLARYGTIPDKVEYAWQVKRSVYDEILLAHAEESGVEVRRGVAVEGVLEDGERIAGVTAKDAKGKAVRLEAEWTADCSGQNGFLSRFRRIRDYNPDLKNVAGYAYYRGAPWKYNYTGHPDKTKIFICSVEHGWFWYIPLEKELVSVGFVTTLAHLKKQKGKDLRALFDSELGKCRELKPLLAKAERVADYEGTGKDFFTHSDWSYLTVGACGPGWLAAGDAAVFVDPILSSGVTLAHLCAHRAAYTLLSHWKEGEGPMRRLLWEDYDRFCRESAAQYLVLALFWYGNDRKAETWWAKARELQRAWIPVDLSDKGAFITVSAGLTQFYDRMFSTRALAEETLTEPKDYPFYMSVLGSDSLKGKREEDALDLDAAPRLSAPYRVEVVFAPAEGKPALRPVKRVRFEKQDPDDALRDAFNPRKIATRYHLEALALIDGARSVRQLAAALEAKGVPAWWTAGPLPTFLRDLRVQGVLEIAEAAVA